ncbi:MAG TPA: sugar transferase [Thermoleophilaceae bacterium]|nr:sugar transferase [Thermoleophilaceae bacterium]
MASDSHETRTRIDIADGQDSDDSSLSTTVFEDGAESAPSRPRTRRFARPGESPVRTRPRPDGRGGIVEGKSASVYRRGAIFKRALIAADLVSAGFAVAAGVAIIGRDHLRAGDLIALPLVVLVSKAAGLYDRDEHLLRKSTLDEVPVLFEASALYALILWLGEAFLVDGRLSHIQVIGLWGLLFIFMFAARFIARLIVEHALPAERCLVIGDALSAEQIKEKIDRSIAVKATLPGRVPLERELRTEADPTVLGELDELGIVLALHDIDRVVIAPGSSDNELLLHAIRLAKSLGVKVSVLPRLFEVVGSSVEFDDLDGVQLLGLRGQGLSRSSLLLKRGMDVMCAGAGLIVLAPCMLLIGLAVKLTSHGPVLFEQRRIGRHGVAFRMLKFRTMCDGADGQKAALRDHNEANDGFFKIADDPRLTRVGRLLRRGSLDELPQLWNVLRGEMSLVGPRPLVADEDECINGWQRTRLELPPGMTGFWQVLGSSRVPMHEMVKLDYLYGANWSLWLDVKIILRTVPHMLAGRGL